MSQRPLIRPSSGRRVVRIRNNRSRFRQAIFSFFFRKVGGSVPRFRTPLDALCKRFLKLKPPLTPLAGPRLPPGTVRA